MEPWPLGHITPEQINALTDDERTALIAMADTYIGVLMRLRRTKQPPAEQSD
ncbi:hypothetical protein P3W66_08355 [Achromobacter denitrificans]|uniref:Uncharacterized protein n=1 Tax=Achromobacter denitrificans TaxID=32002 RepID=A0A6N0JV92_ACHDE|nr:hypothetical protein [Achromobacter denitrificans]MDF3940036.1 hypothetical protein [Achromobacter denitrificans]QKQ45202.1 hypothetical protein FOC81_00130 [Achromobacter denitrificans]QKQ51081.1 hypothetical protein FOC81_31925 [Achromobacter denitrificans]